MNYIDHVQTGLDPIVNQIIRCFDSVQYWNGVIAAAAVHKYIHEKIEYEERGSSPNRRQFRSPKETWKSGGNCQEKAVLLASLYQSLPNVQIRGLSLHSHRDKYHFLPQITFNTEQSIIPYLLHFYRNTKHFDGQITQIHFDQNEPHSSGTPWFICDIGHGKHVGDIDWLISAEYIYVHERNEKGEPGRWEWAHEPDYYDLNKP